MPAATGIPRDGPISMYIHLGSGAFKAGISITWRPKAERSKNTVKEECEVARVEKRSTGGNAVNSR